MHTSGFARSTDEDSSGPEDPGSDLAAAHASSDALLQDLTLHVARAQTAPQIPFVFHSGGPIYPTTLDPGATPGTLLSGLQGAGAGKIELTTGQWLNVTNRATLL